jgi:hypothetical protein
MSPEIVFTVDDSVLYYAMIDGSLRLSVQTPETTGAPVLLPSCRYGEFHEGIATALDTVLDGIGFINSKGLFITSMHYIAADDFSEGRSFVTDDTSTKLIDTNGTILRDFGSILITGRFSQGIALVSKILNDTSGEYKRDAYVDKQGIPVIQFGDPDRIVSPEIISDDDAHSEGLIRVHTPHAVGRRYGFMDLAEKLRIPMMYDDAGRFVLGLAPVAKNGQWGFIDKQNKTQIEFAFDGAKSFAEGLAAVSVQGVWGYCDSGGQIAIAPAFERADPFRAGTARVKSGGKYGIIDAKGAFLAPPIFDGMTNFNHGVCRILLEGKEGFMNRAGEMLFGE